MFGTIRFVITFIFVFIGVSFIAVAWPKITNRPRPKMLDTVYRLTRNTGFAKETAQVLGITDEMKVEPVNLSQLANGFASALMTAVEHQAKTIIVTQATRALFTQYQTLSDDQKAIVRSMLCAPLESTGSSVFSPTTP